MKRLLNFIRFFTFIEQVGLILFCAFCVFAQTSQYPNSIAGPQQLGVVANGVTGTLNNSLTTSSTSANITNGTCTLGGQATTCSVAFQPYMFVTIQNEIMQICSIGSGTGVTILNFGILGSACPSISGRGLDGTQIAAHTTPSFPNKITVYNNITAWTHMADSAEIQAIETNVIGSSLSVKSFGAKCDGGITDDTVAIQASIDYFVNAGKGGTLTFPKDGLCGISPPYITIRPTAAGLTLQGLGTIPSGVYSAGAGSGGVVAIGSSSNLPIFNVLAGEIRFTNMYIDAAAKAKIGIQNVLNNSGLVEHTIVRNTSGDGITVCNECTPVMSILSGGGVGATSATLDSTSPYGVIVNGPGICTGGVIFGYGTANTETRAITSGAGVNPITWATPLLHAQTTAICHGNDDFLKILNYRDLIPGGWGLHVVAGGDSNGITVLYRQSNNATSGGDLWESGSNATDLFGGYEGGSGPAIQLGITSSTFGGPAFGRFGLFSDAEQSNSLYNSIVSVCGSGSNTIFTRVSTDLQYATSASTSPLPNSCPAYPNGTSDIGIGTNNSDGQFIVQTASGQLQFDTNNSTWLSFADKAGTILASLIKSAVTAGGMEVSKDSTFGTGFQFAVSDKTQPAYKTVIGVNHDGTYGWMGCTVWGSSTIPCKYNPTGGANVFGTGGFTSMGTLGKNISLTATNYIASETGSNNAIAVTFNDPFGTAIPLNAGLRIIVHLAHTLQAGANTLTFNGVTKNIVSGSNYGSNIGTAYIVGSDVDLLYDNGVWMAMGR